MFIDQVNWYQMDKERKANTFSAGRNRVGKHCCDSEILLKQALSDPSPNEFTRGWISSCRKLLEKRKQFVVLPYECGPAAGCLHKKSFDSWDDKPFCENCGMYM